MNCGGRSSQASLKLRPSPKDGMLYWFAVMSSKKELRNLLSDSDRSGAPGAGSGASNRGSWAGSTESGARISGGRTREDYAGAGGCENTQPKGSKGSDSGCVEPILGGC